jgi:hypothetical protein
MGVLQIERIETTHCEKRRHEMSAEYQEIEKAVKSCLSQGNSLTETKFNTSVIIKEFTERAKIMMIIVGVSSSQ